MIIITLFVLLLDIISKIIIRHYFFLGESVRIISNFNITYVKNTGAAWSIFQNNTFLVLIISAMVIVGMIVYVYHNKPKIFINKLSFGFILGGAMGNFIDRLIYGYVIDFIDIKIFGYDYPIFNIADIFIVVGVIILIVITWRVEKNENYSS